MSVPTDFLTDLPTLITRACDNRFLSERVTEDATFADLQIDNLDRICIACAVEEAFTIELRDAEVEGWERIGDVMASAGQAGAARKEPAHGLR